MLRLCACSGVAEGNRSFRLSLAGSLHHSEMHYNFHWLKTLQKGLSHMAASETAKILIEIGCGLMPERDDGAKIKDAATMLQ